MTKSFFGTSVASLMIVASTLAPAAACTTGSCACGGTVATGTTVVFDGTEAIVTGPACGTDPALTVADGASLDLNGQSLTCDGSFDGIVLSGERSTLQNGGVSGCVDGIVVAGIGGHKLTNVNSSGNADDGFEISSDKNKLATSTADGNGGSGFGSGFKVTGAKNKIQQSSASLNVFGFQVSGDANTFKKNAAYFNSTSGFLATAGLKNKFLQNVAMHNSAVGLGGAAPALLLQGNVAIGNGDQGILLLGDGAKAIKNTASSNVLEGIQLDADFCKLLKNRTDGNAWGIRLLGGANGNKVDKNVALRNGNQDMEDGNPSCDTNAWSGNVFGTSSVPGGPDPCLQ